MVRAATEDFFPVSIASSSHNHFTPLPVHTTNLDHGTSSLSFPGLFHKQALATERNYSALLHSNLHQVFPKPLMISRSVISPNLEPGVSGETLQVVGMVEDVIEWRGVSSICIRYS